MVRGLIFGALAFGVAFAAERQYTGLGKDLARFDKLRAMSGDSPFLKELAQMAVTAISEFGATRGGGARDLFGSLTSDIVRYATLRRM
jgi:hypothetical protein